VLKTLNEQKILLLILLSGILLRFYNINFDDYWYDEIISFWVSNPEHSLSKSFDIHNKIEVNTYTYHFFLKTIYHLFGYDPAYGRYFSAFFGILSLLLIIFFFNDQKNKNLNNFSLFLLSLNIYHISYSQEARVYSILFFFSLLSFLFFFRSIEKQKVNLNYLAFILFSLIAVFLHPFSLIILFSFITFLLLRFIFKKVIYKKLNYSILIITLISILFYFFYLMSLELIHSNHYWIENPDLGFYSNFFFSNFFGSRLMGIIFLLSLLLLIFKNIKIFLKLDILTVFLISIFLGYFLPIIFGYLYKPVLISRYIIFVLIPIILLISNLIFKINNSKIKNFIVIFLISITIANHFTEQSFKQFFSERVPSKPQYKKALKFIADSEIQNYTVIVKNMKSDKETLNSIVNYIDILDKKNNFNINYIDLSDTIDFISQTWVFCPQDINSKECNVPKPLSNYKIIQEKNFNNINLKLVKLI